MYRYQFPIGDWSGDGHEKCDYFIVTGSKPIEEVVKAHNKSENILGFKIGNIANTYDSTISDEQIESISKLNISTKGFEDWFEFHDESSSRPTIPKDWFENGLNPEELLVVWLLILNHIDSELNLRYTDDIPKMLNYVDIPGYGLFI